MKFKYSSIDFIWTVPIQRRITASKFDRLLCKTWDCARDSGYFRYKLDDPLPTKILSGKHGFVVQLNEKRAVERRRPQDIISVSQMFDERLFNFTKVAEREILFTLEKTSSQETESCEHTQCETSNKSKITRISDGRHLLVINVSPLEYGNSLLVPFVDSRLPQVLTREGIEMALEMVLLSSNPAFRVGFNSLCANASVNHFHFHVFYLGHNLVLETVFARPLVGDCFEICDYPAVGFAFQASGLSDVAHISKLVFRLSEYLQMNEIPHNLFVTRGANFGDGGRQRDQLASQTNDDVDCRRTNYDAVRVFLWARKPVYGIKDDLAFNVACCELAGHLPVKQKDAYDSISEDQVCDELNDACFDAFNRVRPEIIRLLQL